MFRMVTAIVVYLALLPGANAQDMGAILTGEMRGPLLVGASTTIAEFMLPRVLGEFNALYPQVRARLIVGNSESIEGQVAEHTLDVGLIEAPAGVGRPRRAAVWDASAPAGRRRRRD